MECPQIDLYEFLTESELQHYYNAVKNELKITNAAQFKYATDEDLKHIGLSRPEIRRLRKFYEKHFPHGYLSKIKRLLQAPSTIVKRDDGTSVLSSHSSVNSTESTGATTKASPSKAPNNKHIIPADSISVNKQLGTGEFGIVQQGVWTNGTERIQVAIKCLCRERMQSNPMEFLKEAAIMHSIEHENIVRLYGVVLATDSLMLVTELAHLRSLLECLKDPGLRVSFLTIPTLCEFAMQICNGMRYLENKRLIHRDLAARNILVFSKNKVKISDFGLSRALGVGKDYYKTNFNVNLKLPIAWCAPECINYLRFTNASDVWAYGVCLWEMFSYGFQPWAALTGLQILEAIDAPNYQRLEQPECCPREYYTLMMKCWQDDPGKRPKFSEIYELLPDMKPEQLKAVVNCLEPKKDHLVYRQGDIVTVLDRNTGTPFWKGVLNSGKTGYFNPSNTVAYMEGLPTSNRDSFCRISERSSKRKLRTEMISKPQNDLKHTGHVGIDGASFGDIAFLGNSQSYNHVPRQIVTPYKPSEDIEQTPLLLPPTPTSPDSLQTASGYFADGTSSHSMNPSFVPSAENTPKHLGNAGQSSFEFPNSQAKNFTTTNSTNPFVNRSDDAANFAMQNNNYGADGKSFTNNDGSILPAEDSAATNRVGEVTWRSLSTSNIEDPHEYHEISDDEIAADFGPSLMDEINSMIGSMSAATTYQKSPDFDRVNIKNEFTEMSSKASRKNSGGDSNGNKFGVSLSKKKTSGTVKPISLKDEKILNHAIEIANEISARSMNDLVTEQSSATLSPKRKFSFRFPHLSNNGSHEKSSNSSSPSASGASGANAQMKASSPFAKKKNFTEELQSIPDLQAIIGEEGREAYNNLIERKASLASTVLNPAATLLKHLEINEFDMATSKTLPRRSLHLHHDNHGFPSDQLGKYDDKVNHQVAIPLQPAPRPMTLPTRSKGRKSDQSPIGGKQVNLDYSNAMVLDVAPHDANSPCESPSYLTNTFYKFPEAQAEANGTIASPSEETNPLPIPSREGKKHIKTNPKRHVRKYPLIIPANGVQRTLNKVTEASNPDDDSKFGSNSTLNNNNKDAAKITFEVVPTVRKMDELTGRQQTAKEKETEAAHTYQNLEKISTDFASPDTASLQFESILEADFNKESALQSPDVTDGFYNFSIQKEHYNKDKGVDFGATKISGLYVNEDELRNLDIEGNIKVAMQSVANASTSVAATLPEPTALSKGKDSVMMNKVTTLSALDSAKMRKSPMTSAESELAGNALFRKVRESVNLAMSGTPAATVDLPTVSSPTDNTAPADICSPLAELPPGGESPTEQPVAQTEGEYFASVAARLADSNSVSCEDLLEFSDKKPKGCERGVDSDEVRIMMKVLGNDTTPTRCLHVLEFIEWDVHKAIKLIRLQNILASHSSNELSLAESVDILHQYNWDIYTIAIKLKGGNKP